MHTTTDKKEALRIFELEGGFLLDVGGIGDEKTYAVCDEDEAIELFGRTRGHLDSLAPTFSEVTLPAP